MSEQLSTPTRPALIVQLSDPHIVANARLCLNQIDTASFLRAAVDTVNRLDPQPDAVWLTGDLVNEGRGNQYEHLRTLLAPLNASWYLLPGNHDDRVNMRAEFPDHHELFRSTAGREGELALDDHGAVCDHYVVVNDLLVIALDTSVPGEPGGDVRAAQFVWLREVLDAHKEHPVLLLMHHPPFATGVGHMDAQGLAPAAAAKLERIVRSHKRVERVSCGHLHRAISRRWAGTVAATVPSVAHAVTYDIRPGARGSWNYEPPAITVHQWDGSALVTHQVAIGDFPAQRYGAG